jgi:hypothetical protein
VKRITVTILCAATLLGGCATNNNYRPTKTSLEIQAIQAKQFETSKKVAFASVLSVFQDLGYVINSSEIETGFITAKSPTQSGMTLFNYVMTDTKATAFIEEMQPGNTKVRLNFVNSEELSGGYGAKQMQETPIEDPAVYNNAFTKIQEAIFIRTSIK